MTQAIAIDAAIARVSEAIAEYEGIQIRLHENAEVLWLILIPATTETEFFRLPGPLQQTLCGLIEMLGECLLGALECDKINIASIGNVVSQMHLHVIGRRHDDLYWPDVVWGKPYEKNHLQRQIERISRQVNSALEQRCY